VWWREKSVHLPEIQTRSSSFRLKLTEVVTLDSGRKKSACALSHWEGMSREEGPERLIRGTCVVSRVRSFLLTKGLVRVKWGNSVRRV
jgi:hypothetical protein